MLPPADTSSVTALRARILVQSEQFGALSRPAVTDQGKLAVPFEAAMSDALKAVRSLQNEASAKSAAFERGETQDLAAVIIAWQQASLAFEATLQVRNKLLGDYKDVMRMPL